MVFLFFPSPATFWTFLLLLRRRHCRRRPRPRSRSGSRSLSRSPSPLSSPSMKPASYIFMPNSKEYPHLFLLMQRYSGEMSIWKRERRLSTAGASQTSSPLKQQCLAEMPSFAMRPRHSRKSLTSFLRSPKIILFGPAGGRLPCGVHTIREAGRPPRSLGVLISRPSSIAGDVC